jgi:hypothetical protein
VIVMMRPRRSPSTQQAAQNAPELVERGAVDPPGGAVRIDAQQEQQFRPVDVSMPAITVWSSST